MNCPHCLQHVPEGSAFCPYCGARVAEPEPGALPEAHEDPTYGALAHANLLRLRGDWNAARDKTVAVMREFPNSGTAHSLMGDIFADQEMDEDAAQWYRMALELEPDNMADRRKLATVEARLAELKKKEGEPATDEDAPPSFSGFRVAAWAAGAFLVLLIALGLWLNQTSPRPRPDMDQPTPHAATPRAPTEAPRAEPETPVPDPDHTTGTPPAAEPEPSAASGETRVEADLRSHLAALDGSLAAAGLQIADLQIDPRTQSAGVTLDGSGVNGLATDWMGGIYRGALAVAARAFLADKSLARVRVRVVMPLSTPSGVESDVAFIGDAARPAGFDAAPNAALTRFERRWWRSGLTPPPNLATTP